MTDKLSNDQENRSLDDELADFTDLMLSGKGSNLISRNDDLSPLEIKIIQLDKLLNTLMIDTKENDRIKVRLIKEWETRRGYKFTKEKRPVIPIIFNKYRLKNLRAPIMIAIVFVFVLIYLGYSQLSKIDLSATAGQFSGNTLIPILAVIVIIIIVYVIYGNKRN